MSPTYLALVHHPVLDRAGNEVTTSVTNLDVHDIARSSRTYGLKGYFVVNPIEAQHPVVQKIIDHWSTGAGVRRFPERTEAIGLVQMAGSVDEAIAEIEQREGSGPRLVATSAKGGPDRSSYAEEVARLRSEPPADASPFRHRARPRPQCFAALRRDSGAHRGPDRVQPPLGSSRRGHHPGSAFRSEIDG